MSRQLYFSEKDILYITGYIAQGHVSLYQSHDHGGDVIQGSVICDDTGEVLYTFSYRDNEHAESNCVFQMDEAFQIWCDLNGYVPF